MRMHKFKSQNADVWINLDAIAIVQPRGIMRTIIKTNGCVQEVDGSVDDVLALISPPAAGDRFEEEQAAYNEFKTSEIYAEGVKALTAKRSREADPLEVDKALDAARLAGWQSPDVVRQRIALARLDELERAMRSVLGRSEAYWPVWAKSVLEARRNEINMGNV